MGKDVTPISTIFLVQCIARGSSPNGICTMHFQGVKLEKLDVTFGKPKGNISTFNRSHLEVV